MSIALSSHAIDRTAWCLRGRTQGGEALRQFDITSSPFRVGRLTNLSLTLLSPAISKLHAELHCCHDALIVHDNDSTNGTYINGHRVHQASALQEGDLLQFADVAFRVGINRSSEMAQTQHKGSLEWAQTLIRFDELMSEQAIVPFFQPLVKLDSLAVIGYESLGRSKIKGLETPRSMFAAAEQLDVQCQLSVMLRNAGISAGSHLAGRPNVFVNTHPDEIGTPQLIASLEAIRRRDPTQPLTVELHEAAVTSTPSLKEFQAALRDLDIRLAYDDFGAGQARLIELSEAPPDYVKFDRDMVTAIHLSGGRRQRLLASLVQMVNDMGVITVAEGVESGEEATACRQLGFDLAQGYYYGRPAPLEQCR